MLKVEEPMVTAIRESRIDPACRTVLDELEAHVECCLGSRIRDFAVEYQDGGLRLRGRTHSYYAKQLAQLHVQRLGDLPISVNDIEVV